VALVAGEDERGVAVVALGVLVRARLQQRLRDLDVVIRAGEVERGLVELVLGFLVRARLQQR